jgi:hypothetical protein
MCRIVKLLVVVLVATAAAGLGAGARPAEPRSPLAAYPGFGHDPEADEERFTTEEQRREELVAACMAARGFLYLPSPSVVITGEETEPPDTSGPNDV